MVELAAGQNVYMQGDTGSCFYVIKEGSVTCTKTTDPTKPPAVFTLNAGQFFGERALLKDEVRQAPLYWVFSHFCKSAASLDGYTRHSQLSFEARLTHAGLGCTVYWFLAWTC